jgi:hypothetical protein
MSFVPLTESNETCLQNFNILTEGQNKSLNVLGHYETLAQAIPNF